MINSHLLYRLSYRGTSVFQLINAAPFDWDRVAEARHFTYGETPVNP